MKRCISLLLAALLSFAGASARAGEPVLSMPEASAESGLNETEDCPAAESDSLSAMSDAPGGYEDPAMEPSGTGDEAEPANAHADDSENADVSGAAPAEVSGGQYGFHCFRLPGKATEILRNHGREHLTDEEEGQAHMDETIRKIQEVDREALQVFSEFCAAHVSRLSLLRCDAHPSHGRALSGGWDAVPRPSGADGDSEASLPAVHHAISNLKAKLAGTAHGVTCERLQEHLDEFSWKYSHRLGDELADLLGELARWPHVPLRAIRSVALRQPAHEGGVDPGYRHNRKVEGRARRAVMRALATDVASVASLKAVP